MKLHVCCLYTGGAIGWSSYGLCQVDSHDTLSPPGPVNLEDTFNLLEAHLDVFGRGFGGEAIKCAKMLKYILGRK